MSDEPNLRCPECITGDGQSCVLCALRDSQAEVERLRADNAEMSGNYHKLAKDYRALTDENIRQRTKFVSMEIELEQLRQKQHISKVALSLTDGVVTKIKKLETDAEQMIETTKQVEHCADAGCTTCEAFLDKRYGAGPPSQARPLE